MRLIVGDKCLGMLDAAAEVFPQAKYQRCTVHFYRNVFSVVPKSKVKLIAKMLKADPTLKLNVVGHTDNVGGMDSNMKLSMARGEAVVQALVARYGIAADRLKGYGVSSLAPVASNDSDAGRAKNRRVELVKQ